MLFQLDAYPVGFQREFLKIYAKNFNLEKNISYLFFKLNTLPKEIRVHYMPIFSQYFSEKNYLETLNFIENLEDKELETFLIEYFPDPENFINFVLNLKRNLTSKGFEILLEKLSLIVHSKLNEAVMNLLEKSQEREGLILKISSLALDWKGRDIKPLLFWILTKTHNPIYRNKISNTIEEISHDN